VGIKLLYNPKASLRIEDASAAGLVVPDTRVKDTGTGNFPPYHYNLSPDKYFTPAVITKTTAPVIF
jgi:hypothetical protein